MRAALMAPVLVAACVASPRASVPETSRGPLPALAGLAPVRPVDDAARDATLLATRDSLRAIVARRDSAALTRFLAPDVTASFGGDDGPSAFFAIWRQSGSLDALWRTLADVLAHGGRFQSSDLFSAPWTFTALPDSLDAFTHVIVRDSAVVVRAAPADTGTPIGTLSYTVVRAVPEAEGVWQPAAADRRWQPIALPDGRRAYVPAAQVRSAVDYRLGLGRRGTRWVIQFFVAGD